MVFVTARKDADDSTSSISVLSPKAESPLSPLRSSPKIHKSSSGLLNISSGTVVGDHGDNSQPMTLSLSFLNKKRHSVPSTLPEYDSPRSDSSVSSSFAPKLIRKKSGELVKSSLKLNSLMDNASKSMPTTPTFKNVHFGQDVDVRYFNEKEKPSAVSASNSPVLKSTKLRRWSKSKIGTGATFEFNQFGNGGNFNSDYDSIDDIYDDDDDMSDDIDVDEDYEVIWDLENVNFTKVKYNEKFHEKSKIFLERLTLDDENEDKADNALVGLIAVKNLSFEKKIHVRYTFDNWRTVIEIEARFDNEGSTRVLKRANYDRFKFKIPLSNFKFLNQDNIKILFCIRYRYEHHEVWDNNDFKNFELLLTRSRRSHYYSKRSKFMLNDYFSQDHRSDDFGLQYHQENYPMSPMTQTHSVPGSSYNTLMPITDSYFNNYDPSNIKSPETPRVLKNGAHPNNEDIEEDPLITPILKDLNNFTDLSTPPSSSQANDETITVNNLARSANKMSLLSDDDNFVIAATTEPRTDNLSTNNTDYNPSQRMKPQINSKSYQELLDSYCFFKGSDNNTPSTISSYLNDKP